MTPEGGLMETPTIRADLVHLAEDLGIVRDLSPDLEEARAVYRRVYADRIEMAKTDDTQLCQLIAVALGHLEWLVDVARHRGLLG